MFHTNSTPILPVFFAQENTETSIIKAYALVRAQPAESIAFQLQRIAEHIRSEWTLLPPHCVNPKVAVLQRMHQLSEVDESFRIVQDIRRHSPNGAAVRCKRLWLVLSSDLAHCMYVAFAAHGSSVLSAQADEHVYV